MPTLGPASRPAGDDPVVGPDREVKGDLEHLSEKAYAAFDGWDHEQLLVTITALEQLPLNAGTLRCALFRALLLVRTRELGEAIRELAAVSSLLESA